MRIRQLGLSLVEIMVAVVIGLIGILIITQAYITSDNFNRSTMGEGGAQMNGLLALYSVERDLRQAGWGINNSQARGCGNLLYHYNGGYSVAAGGALPDVRVAPVVITTNATPTNPDTITVFYGTDGERMMPTTINAWSAATPDISVDGADGFSAGNLVILVSASGCTLRGVSTVQVVSQKLEMAPTAALKQNPAGWGTFASTYAKDDAVLNLGTPVLRTYLISNGKLASDDGLLTAGAMTRTDVTDSIVDMRALYGKDTDANNIVDTYDTTTPTTAAGWLQVLSVKVAILARIGNFEKPSTSGGNCDATTAVPTWSGSATNAFQAIDIATVTSQDRCYRYRVFETTVPLRNMIWAAS
jgi:type IV pilus assembly protein PilW